MPEPYDWTVKQAIPVDRDANLRRFAAERAATEALLRATRAAGRVAMLRQGVERAEMKRQKQRQHLAGAEQSLADAQAALAALEGA